MKYFFILVLVHPILLFSQQSVSVGFAWTNEPFNPDGYAINTDHTLSISDNGKWYFKPNAGYKNMKNYEDYLQAELQNQAIGLHATLGYALANNENYKLITYLGPSLRWNRFWGRLDHELLNIFTQGTGAWDVFYLSQDKREDSLTFTRFGYAFQVENQFKIGKETISVVPFLEPDISFAPNSGGFYVSYYLK